MLLVGFGTYLSASSREVETNGGHFRFQEKFSKLLSIIPEIHSMASRGEEHLYMKHCAGSAPTQTLLMEMLHAKRK